MSRGLPLIDSSAVLITVGRIMADNVNPPERMDHPIFKLDDKKDKPEQPKDNGGHSSQTVCPETNNAADLTLSCVLPEEDGCPNSEGCTNKDGYDC